MFDIGKFGSSFRGGPLNGFDAMVMSEAEQKKKTLSDAELDEMRAYLVAHNYIAPQFIQHYSPKSICDMYNYYTKG